MLNWRSTTITHYSIVSNLLILFFIIGLDRLVEPLRATCTTKVKAHSVKQEFEKQDELKRSAMRAVAALLAITDAGTNKFFIKISILLAYIDVEY